MARAVRIVRRVLVTGSRAWEDARPIVWAALDRELDECPIGDDLEIIHGGASGPDLDAKAWVDDWVEHYDRTRFAGISVLCFRPNYAMYHANVAPLMRNQVMVDEKPYRCLAFHKDQSAGTADCIERALKAQIPAHIYRPGCTEPEIIAPLF